MTEPKLKAPFRTVRNGIPNLTEFRTKLVFLKTAYKCIKTSQLFRDIIQCES